MTSRVMSGAERKFHPICACSRTQLL